MKRYIRSESALTDVDHRDLETLSYLSGMGDKKSIKRKQKQYVYRCVAESPQIPDIDTDGEEAMSQYTRDVREYRTWCFVDAVDLGIFTKGEKDLFYKLWEQAETDMAQPYA